MNSGGHRARRPPCGEPQAIIWDKRTIGTPPDPPDTRLKNWRRLMPIQWSENLSSARETFVTHLECSMTGERHEADRLHGLSRAGWPLLVRYDLEGVRRSLTKEKLAGRPMDLWRYRELLPVREAESITSLGETATPLVQLHACGERLGLEALLVKDEGRLPTGSFKARGITMAVSMAKELGVTKIAMPTNGNAGAALAAYGSRAGMETVVLCPDDTPEINVREIAMQGARVYRVNGLIDNCGKIVAEGAKKSEWFDLSTLKEPYRIEGKKTMGLELAEQLGWQVPDVIFYPTGGGTGLIGMWKAFAELEALGFIGPERPRMVAVQAEGCAPIVKAFEDGEEHAPRWEDAHTVAAGIRVPKAIGDFLILRAVRESGGFAIAASDTELTAAVEEAAQKDGMLLCPEGGATLAACQKALANGLIRSSDRVVLFNCATGLKYPMPDLSHQLDRHDAIDHSAL
jgi:threonine synthase